MVDVLVGEKRHFTGKEDYWLGERDRGNLVLVKFRFRVRVKVEALSVKDLVWRRLRFVAVLLFWISILIKDQGLVEERSHSSSEGSWLEYYICVLYSEV